MRDLSSSYPESAGAQAASTQSAFATHRFPAVESTLECLHGHSNHLLATGKSMMLLVPATEVEPVTYRLQIPFAQ
jgi:hypothetical protein